MYPSRNIKNASSTFGENHHMFLRQLSSSVSSILPRSPPALSRAGFRSSSVSSSYVPHLVPAPRPWWPVRGFPPWPPRLPHQVFFGRTLRPRSINPGYFTGGCHPFYTSAGVMMERRDRDREPPYKRRKSAEEARSVKEKEGQRGGAAGGKDKDKGSKWDSGTDSCPRSNNRFKDGSRERGRNGAGKDVRRENSRDAAAERTKTGIKDRQRKDSDGGDETPNRGRAAHQQRQHEDSQPARSRTQTPQSKPEPEQVTMHKPNPWFKGRGVEEQGGWQRSTRGPEGRLRDRGSDGGQWPELPSQ
ncbi:octapeptide-repeat protein T2-like, partial [Pempheris klunzingeri]|uniref:octapeptide-repeat protein T2-like n=1 Tax=Pempheris klunzingeri TaxID=3127111 RepID=UPI0039810F18